MGPPSNDKDDDNDGASLITLSPRTFKPYETSTRDTPMFHMIAVGGDQCCMSKLAPCLAFLYRIR